LEENEMGKRSIMISLLIGVLMSGMFVFSCTSIPEIQVLYRLPAPSMGLQGKSVVLKIIDKRADKEFLRPGARRQFKYFSGNLSFAVAKYNEAGFKIGPFDPIAVIKEGFKRRLENDGIRIVSEPAEGVPELQIILEEFSLDFVARQWVATMRYEAKLLKDSRVLANQSISGKAERFKILRRKGADTALGDIFTDTLNRLDLVKLFHDAHLLNP